MGISKYYLLVTSTVLMLALVNQSEAHHSISENISKPIAGVNKKFDAKAALGGDGNIVIAMAQKAIEEVHRIAANHTRPGPIGEAIKVFRDGWERTLKLVADALDEGFDLIDNLLGKVIKDKKAALNSINNGMNDVRSSMYRSHTPVHSCLGAGKAVANITDKGKFKYAIDKIQETGTGLFDDIEVAQLFAVQGLNSHDDEVTQKCLKASHSAFLSAAEIANTNFIDGAVQAFQYLSNSDAETIMQHEPAEKLISDAAKEAAAADSDTVAAMEALNKEFDLAIKLGIDASILNEIKTGLKQYYEHCAWSIVTLYHALAQAKALAKTDPQAAIRVIVKAVEIAKSILIDGSVKAYEYLGSAGRASGSLDRFQDAMEIAERSRIEGTKGMESAKIAAIRGIETGKPVTDHALDAAHKMLEATEAVIFGYLHEGRHKTFNALNPEAILDDS